MGHALHHGQAVCSYTLSLSLSLFGVIRIDLTLEFVIMTGTPDCGTPTMVNPASSLLHDLLKEQRAHRSSRGAGSEDWSGSRPRTPEARNTQDDTASEKSRKLKDAFSANSREQPKEMGVREMDQVGLSVERFDRSTRN